MNPDQAALYGLLQKTRDLGLPLISVNHVEPDHPRVPTIETRQHGNPRKGTDMAITVQTRQGKQRRGNDADLDVNEAAPGCEGGRGGLPAAGPG
jgi:hypothetical protein